MPRPSRATSWPSAVPTPRRAGRSTRDSGSTATSTSGGASSCATRAKERRRGAPSSCPAAPRATRTVGLDLHPGGRSRTALQAQLLPSPRPLPHSARPRGRSRQSRLANAAPFAGAVGPVDRLDVRGRGARRAADLRRPSRETLEPASARQGAVPPLRAGRRRPVIGRERLTTCALPVKTRSRSSPRTKSKSRTSQRRSSAASGARKTSRAMRSAAGVSRSSSIASAKASWRRRPSGDS